MADKNKRSGMPRYDHWLDGVSTEEQLKERVKDVAKQMRRYCAENIDSQYGIMTKSEKYHGADRHLHRTDMDDVTRMWDDGGKNNHFREDMTNDDLEMNTMSMIDEFGPEIIMWRTMSPGRVKRLKLVMPIDPSMDENGNEIDRVGSGFQIDRTGALHKYSTNAQTVILEKTRDFDTDDNPLGCRIITEYPCIETTDNLLDTLNKVKNRPDHIWYGRFGAPDQQIYVKGVQPEDETKIEVKEVTHELDPDDVYHGIARSDNFKNRRQDYLNTETENERKSVEETYERAVSRMGMKQAAPDIRGRRREVPDKFEEIYKASLALDEGRDGPEKD